MKKLSVNITIFATICALCLFSACSNDTTNSNAKTSATDDEQTETSDEQSDDQYEINNYGIEEIPCSAAITSRKEQPSLIERDLIGRTISYDYYGQQSNWIIEPREIKDVEITKCQDSGDEFLMELKLLLHSAGADYNANIEANYVFNERKGWEIEYINLLPDGWSVVETGKYKKFITKEITGGWTSAVYLRNSSDMQLKVYGYTHSSYGGGWEPFQLQVPANDRAHLSYDTGLEIQIDLVERP